MDDCLGKAASRCFVKDMITHHADTRNLTNRLVSIPPLSQCEVCVIIPIKDEAETIIESLDAFSSQTCLSGQPLSPDRYEIIVLANNCCDESAQIARQFAKQHPLLSLHIVEITLPPEHAYVGYARKLLMDEAYKRLISLGRNQGIIASTDGDTKVSATWIAAMLHEISLGADAIGGRIITDRQSRQFLPRHVKACFLQEVAYCSLVAEIEFYLDPDSYDPLPRHYQHYGASLAVTAEIYAQSGGLPPVRTPEDEAFYQSLLRLDVKFRHSPLVKVTTSARQKGRSPVGLANQLQKWANTPASFSFEVESVDAVMYRFELRRKLRLLWERTLSGHTLLGRDMELLAHKIGICPGFLEKEIVQSQTFGNFYEKIIQHQQSSNLSRWPLIDVKLAIIQLRNLVVTLRSNAA